MPTVPFMPGYDVIVIGLGAMGSAAAYHVARRGRSVLGVEQYTPAHDRGASHGKSRIIREAYFEDPAYVPLIQRAYELWFALQQDGGVPLLRITGGLMIGPLEGELVRGALASARTHQLPYELLTAAELRRRFPLFVPDDDTVAVREPRAGVLYPEACVRAHLDGAARAGAALHFEEQVVHWTAAADHVEVTTARGSYAADRLIVTAGPWAGHVLDALGLPLTVERNVMYWFRPKADAAGFSPERFPIYIYEYRRGGFFYGFPALGADGVKVAHHHSGEFCTPESIRREVTDDEVNRMRALLARHLPAANGALLDAVPCMYTNTPDGHFVLDRHPRQPQVTIGCGFSGHGFKFASVVGEILADLALDGRTRHPIDLFRMRRLAQSQGLTQA